MSSEFLLPSTPDTVPGHQEALRRWPKAVTLNWVDVWTTLQEACDEITVARAGGTRMLSGTLPGGWTVAVGSDDGPWTPATPGRWDTVRTRYFLVSVWSSDSRLRDGHDEDAWVCVAPRIPALRTVLGLQPDPISGAITVTGGIEFDADTRGDYTCHVCGLPFSSSAAISRHHTARGHSAFTRFLPPS